MKNDLKPEDVLFVFRMYIGIKLHFNSDKFVYDDNFGNEKISITSMDKRKDIDTFIKVADAYHHKKHELKPIMISLFKNNKDTWIGDVLKKTNQKIHNSRINNIMNLSNVIKNDIDDLNYFLRVNLVSLKDALMFTDDRPLIVKKLKLSDEFLALIDYYIPYLNQHTENPLWKKRSKNLYKYKHLIYIANPKSLELIEDFIQK